MLALIANYQAVSGREHVALDESLTPASRIIEN